MKFGLFSNGQRRNPVAKTSYDLDLQEIIVADELGVHEAWISEHGTLVTMQAPDQLPSADLLICKAAALTKRIRLGPGIRPLPFFHPLQVATDAAVCDHLTGGRYMAGFGVGIGDGRGQRGTLPGTQREMTREAIDLILKAWTSPEPFDWNGKCWQGKNWHIVPLPYTKPHMEVGIACSRSDTTLELCAEKDFSPLISWTPTDEQIAGMIKTYLNAPNAKAPSRKKVRVSRFVYVADSVEQAKRDLRDTDLPPVYRSGRLDAWIPNGGTREDLTADYLVDAGLFFCGPPDLILTQTKALYDSVGGFGTLLLVTGKDWASPENNERSMRRFMTEVAPRLAAIEPN